MESNPGTFGVSVSRSFASSDQVNMKLTLGDARRLHAVLTKGLPDNPYNTIHGLVERLLAEFERVEVHCDDLG